MNVCCIRISIHIPATSGNYGHLDIEFQQFPEITESRIYIGGHDFVFLCLSQPGHAPAGRGMPRLKICLYCKSLFVHNQARHFISQPNSTMICASIRTRILCEHMIYAVFIAFRHELLLQHSGPDSMDYRLRDFQQQLTALEDGLEELKRCKQRLERDVENIRHQMTVMCLATVADCVQDAIKKAHASSSGLEKTKLQEVRQQCLDPSVESRFATYDALRRLHIGSQCPRCQAKEFCPLSTAFLISRDLLVMTIVIGKGAQTTLTLKTAFEEALRSGCNRYDLDKDESSQLTLAFHKVLKLGRTRAGFDDQVKAVSMYGPDLTGEQVDHLFQVYNTISRCSPDYTSSTKVQKSWNREKKPEALASSQGQAMALASSQGQAWALALSQGQAWALASSQGQVSQRDQSPTAAWNPNIMCESSSSTLPLPMLHSSFNRIRCASASLFRDLFPSGSICHDCSVLRHWKDI